MAILLILTATGDLSSGALSGVEGSDNKQAVVLQRSDIEWHDFDSVRADLHTGAVATHEIGLPESYSTGTVAGTAAVATAVDADDGVNVTFTADPGTASGNYLLSGNVTTAGTGGVTGAFTATVNAADLTVTGTGAATEWDIAVEDLVYLTGDGRIGTGAATLAAGPTLQTTELFTLHGIQDSQFAKPRV